MLGEVPPRPPARLGGFVVDCRTVVERALSKGWNRCLHRGRPSSVPSCWFTPAWTAMFQSPAAAW